MRHVLLMGAVVALAVAASADAAPRKKAAKLSVTQVGKPPASLQQGATFKLAVRVANAKHRRASSGRVTISLRPATGAKRALKGGNLKTTKGGARRTLTLSIVVPTTIPAGTYTLTACVRKGSGA